MKPILPLLPALLAGTVLAQEPTPVPTERPTERPYDLMVGDPAPPLTIAEWVRGEPVQTFQPDHVYVVEFWATWCGPCIFGMPHLSDLQEKYADQKVRILGVNIWDEAANVRPFLAEPIDMHDGKTGAEVMRYTVAIETKDGETGTMATAWMAAAGQDGIPSAFVVQDGRVAWIGHPAELDEPLAKIVAGDWDLAAAAAEQAARVAGQAAVERFFELCRNGEFAAAYAHARTLVANEIANDAMALNMVAWTIVDPDAKPPEQDLELALAAAERASELTEHGDASILDTLATVRFERGEVALAVWIQRLALRCADPEDGMLEDYRARLGWFERVAKLGLPAARIEAARLGTLQVHAAAQAYMLGNGGRIPSLEDLLTGDGNSEAWLAGSGNDPWGNAYVIRKTATGSITVVSTGPDGAIDTDDDIEYQGRKRD